MSGSEKAVNRLSLNSPLLRYLQGAAAARYPTVLFPHDFDGADAENAFSSPSPVSKRNQFSSSSGSNGRVGGSSSSFGRSTASSSPLSSLSSLENARKSSVFGVGPLKAMEDDVLVMDAIGVASDVGGTARVSGRNRVLSESGGSSSSSSSSSSSGNKINKTELSSSSGNKINKTELCRAWEDHGYCRYVTKCQFAHGKEELRPIGYIVNNKSEVGSNRSLTPPSYPTKSLMYSPGMTSATANQTRYASNTPEHSNRGTSSFMRSELSSRGSKRSSTSDARVSISTPPRLHLPSRSSTSIKKPEGFRILGSGNTSSCDWSPLDDNIEVFLPPYAEKSTSREDVDAYIDRILHGPSTKKRLPAFTRFFP
ncbi:unnamed protein product [Linum tenue]|uniref:C3H1-type domain-containing protein n=1 Tax=Linum tenue TaxID=586396 RepID=A0AAV0LY81_9ROSI|nr:unnamed protein product [Linum tenue]